MYPMVLQRRKKCRSFAQIVLKCYNLVYGIKNDSLDLCFHLVLCMASFACSWHTQAKKSTRVGLWTKPEKTGLGSSSKIAIWVSYSWTKSTIIFRLSMDLWINATNRLTHLCDQKEKDERNLGNSKAGYTATLVACGWAVIVKVTRAFGQEQWAQNAQKW